MALHHYKEQILGQPTSPRLIASSILLALTVIFYIYAAGTFSGTDVYPLYHRANHQQPFANSLVDQNTDEIIVMLAATLWLVLSLSGRLRITISGLYGGVSVFSIFTAPSLAIGITFLLSIPIMASLLIFDKISSKKILSTSGIISLNYLSLFLIVTSILSIIVSAFLYSSSRLSQVQDYSYGAFLILSSICPVMILALIVYSPIRLFMLRFKKSQSENDTNFSNYQKVGLRTKVLLLVLFALLSIVLLLIPHLAALNTKNGLVGADTGDYVKDLNQLLDPSYKYTQHNILFFWGGERPVSLIFLMAFAKVMPLDMIYAVDHSPLILGPLLVVAVYFLTRELTSNDATALMASFLTAVSFHTLIGIYSGIYSNWFALFFGYLCLTFLIRFGKNPNKLNLAAFGFLLILVLFTHSYTWTILAIFIFILLVILYKLNYYQRHTILLLGLVLASTVIVDVARTELTGSHAGIADDVTLARQGAGPQQLALIWTNLTETVLNYSGGQFGSFPMLALTMFWIVRCTTKNLSSIFMLVFLALGFLPLLFGDTTLQTRVLYNIPFQIPAAIALMSISKKYHGNIISSSLCVWIFAMSIKAVTNFVQ